jgi:hypothetical protein
MKQIADWLEKRPRCRIQSFARERVDLGLILFDPMYTSERRRIAALAPQSVLFRVDKAII